jgi:hypothetical protein
MTSSHSRHWKARAPTRLDRLAFFVLNDLPEAKWELAHVSGKASSPGATYALAWSLFHSQAYNDSIKMASPLRDRFKEPPRSDRILYLLYPAAYPEFVQPSASRNGIDPMLSLAVMREASMKNPSRPPTLAD